MRFISTFFVIWLAGASAHGGYQEAQANPALYHPSVLRAATGYGDDALLPYDNDGFPLSAECLLVASNISSVSGTLQLLQSKAGSPVQISGAVYGLSAGLHGFHMHRDGSVDNNCLGAGPHFNPFNMTHGGPKSDVRHAGDFGNILADITGVADVAVDADLISLQQDSVHYAVGRAIVVHAKEDDLGKGGNEESLKTGNAGGRLACCVVQKKNCDSHK